MPAQLRSRAVAALVLVAILGAGLAFHFSMEYERRPGSDIYYNWVEGQRILKGENPYLRILDSDMRVNQKYPTYFPLIYLLSAATQMLGLRDYLTWLSFWHGLIVSAGVAIGAAIFYMLYQRRGLAAAAFGALFWLFGRWALLNSQASTFDFLPILCMVTSIWLLGAAPDMAASRRRQTVAFLLFSLSLALKHLDAIIVPLFIIWAWQAAPVGRKLRETAWSSVLVFCIPAITVIPFVVWHGQTVISNTEAMLRSLVFEVTRDPAMHIQAPSIDSFMAMAGPAARLPTLIMLALAWGAFTQSRIGLFTAGLMSMAAFLDFNPVFFVQYQAWMVPFVPLAMAEAIQRQRALVAVRAHGLVPGESVVPPSASLTPEPGR
jgi:hypothetical protein